MPIRITQSQTTRRLILYLRGLRQSKKERKARLTGDIKIYAYYAKAVGWLLALYLCLQAATTFLMKFPDMWLGWWSAAETSKPGHRTVLPGDLLLVRRVCSLLYDVRHSDSLYWCDAKVERATPQTFLRYGHVRTIFILSSNRFWRHPKQVSFSLLSSCPTLLTTHYV